MKGYNLAAILLCLSFSFQTWADEQEHTARQQHEAGVPANNSPEILAKWAQLIPASDHSSSPRVSVRVVLKGNHTPCKGILTSFVPPIAETEGRPNSDKERFDITVRETLFHWVANVVTFFDHTPGKPSRLSWSPKLDSIAVIGDTGCRFPERNQGGSADEKTGCNPPGWLFPKASRAIADPRQRPDLVLHVGDYRYRGNASADQDKSKMYPDSWENWEADFFAPANDLLNAAPWVMTRGNHDNCFGKENKGPGWLFLLSPYPTTDDPEPCRKRSEPVQERVYALDLTGSLRLVVLDAANAVNQRAKWEQKFDGEAFKKAIGEAEGRHVWLVSHYPVINIEEDERAPTRFERRYWRC